MSVTGDKLAPEIALPLATVTTWVDLLQVCCCQPSKALLNLNPGWPTLLQVQPVGNDAGIVRLSPQSAVASSSNANNNHHAPAPAAKDSSSSSASHSLTGSLAAPSIVRARGSVSNANCCNLKTGWLLPRLRFSGAQRLFQQH
jgi:hypothetical protein